MLWDNERAKTEIRAYNGNSAAFLPSVLQRILIPSQHTCSVTCSLFSKKILLHRCLTYNTEEKHVKSIKNNLASLMKCLEILPSRSARDVNRNVLFEASRGQDCKRQMQNIFLNHQNNNLKICNALQSSLILKNILHMWKCMYICLTVLTFTT